MEDQGEALNRRAKDKRKPAGKNVYGIIKKLQEENRELREIAYYDQHIKDLLNKKGFEKSVLPQIEFALENDLNITFAFIDMDKLKEVNDKYGHDAGDEMLALLGRVLNKYFKRGSDVIAIDHGSKIRPEVGKRGGDEFLLSLPLTSQEIVEERLNNAREEFENEAGSLINDIVPSFSFGIASMSEKLSDNYDRDKIQTGRIRVENVELGRVDGMEVLNDVLNVAEMRMYKNKNERGQARTSLL